MNTIIFLIVMSLGGSRSADIIVIKEMPNLKVCEQIGKAVHRMSTSTKWNCIEGPR